MKLERTYIIYSEAWYADKNRQDCAAEVQITLTNADGGFGECGVRWHNLSSGPPAPRFEIFNDAWWTLPHLADLMAKMAVAPDKLTPAGLVALLKALGFRDATERTNPRARAKAEPLPLRIRRATLQRETSEAWYYDAELPDGREVTITVPKS